MVYRLGLTPVTGSFATQSFLDLNITRVSQTIESKIIFVFEKLVEERGRIEWVFLLVNLIFSSTFLTIFCIAIILSKDLQRIVFPLVAWVVWLIGSSAFLFARLSIGLYHFLRITLNLIAFVTMKAAAKAISAFQCAKYSFDKDPRELLLVELENAQSFSEWLECAQQLDKLSGALEWRTNPESDMYEWEGLQEQVSRIRSARLSGDVTQLMFLLRVSCSRTFCGISNPQLYTEALSGTKYLVEEFTDEVCQALEFVCHSGTSNPNSTERTLGQRIPLMQGNTIENTYRVKSFSDSSIPSECVSSVEEEFGNDHLLELGGQVMDGELGTLGSDQESGLCPRVLGPPFSDTDPGPDQDWPGGTEARVVQWGGRSVCVRDRCVQTDSLTFEDHRPVVPYSIGLMAQGCSQCGQFSSGDLIARNDSIQLPFGPQARQKIDLLNHKIPLPECSTTVANSSSPCSCLSSLRHSYDSTPAWQSSGSDCPPADFSMVSNLIDCENDRCESNPTVTQSAVKPCGYGHRSEVVYSKSSPLMPSLTLPQLDPVKMRERLKFLITLRLSLGRTALCLSGGGALAMYHMGIIKTLLDHQCLPKVISGTSGGSIVAAIVGISTDKELQNDVLRPDVVVRHNGFRWFPPISKQLQRFFLTGQMMDRVEFERTCQAHYGEYTFRDAFLKTGRLVSIVVTPASRTSGGEALILNHINTPDVFIWSAVTASCSLPGLLPPHELMVRSVGGSPSPYCPSGLKWMDGSITQDIPIKELARLFNVKQFIVSQVNPHHAPFVRSHGSGSPWMQSIENWLTLDIKNRYAMLAKFNMVPKIYGQNISSFWMLQVFEGHVTITPRASLIDWYRMVNQPSVEDMEDFIAKGQQRVWPHMPRIIQMVKIEQTLRRCWAEVSRSVHLNSFRS